jgi:glycosyltransferase involved in cell wall biosynthesis
MDVSITVTLGNTAVDMYSNELIKNLPGVNQIRLYIPHYDLHDSKFKHFIFARRVGDFISKIRACKTSCIHFTSNSLASYFDLIPFVGKKILTVHDIIPFLMKEHRGHALLNMLERNNLKKTDYIIAVSQNTKKDLVKHLRVPEGKITVVYSGINHALFYQRAIKFNFPYILYVGTEEPRKNMGTTLRALHKLVKEFKDLKLIKIGHAGRSMYRYRTLQLIKELKLGKHVIFTGFIDKEELPWYYSSAIALVFPSLYEGFGHPVLEAMACGCPVITSKLSSLPEIAGEAGIMVDAFDDNAIASAIGDFICNKNLRKDMINKGLERAKMFSWEKTSKATLEVYNKLLS